MNQVDSKKPISPAKLAGWLIAAIFIIVMMIEIFSGDKAHAAPAPVAAPVTQTAPAHEPTLLERMRAGVSRINPFGDDEDEIREIVGKYNKETLRLGEQTRRLNAKAQADAAEAARLRTLNVKKLQALTLCVNQANSLQ